MNKKLLVVLVVMTAILVTGALMAAERAAIKGVPEKFQVQKLGNKQSATAMPEPNITEPLAPSPLVPSGPSPSTGAVSSTPPKLPGPGENGYPFSTVAAKPDKVEGYRPPQQSYEGVLKQEGGEDCSTAEPIAVPFNATGYTCDNVDDYEEMDGVGCPYSSTSPDVVYSYTPSVNEVINIDMWGSSYDTKIWVYEDVCQTANLYACNDDYYSNYVSAIFGLAIYSGHTYYIVVDGYGGGCGDYLIDVSYYQECDVVCPPNGIAEGEPDCYDEYVDSYNGGCNSSPYVFQTVNCGDTICGKSGTYLFTGLQYRDTDWFRVVLTSAATLSWKVVAEFPLLIFIMNGGTENCADYTQLGYTTANECDTAFLSFDVQPGVYWLWAGPSTFSGIPCGKEYVGIVGCRVATTGACCLDYDPYTCTITTPEECAALPDHTFKGLGTDCDPNPCLAEGGETCDYATVIPSLPWSGTGYTCDNVDDYEEVCPYSSTSPDVVYSYTPSQDTVIDIDLCNSLYDTKVFVYEDVCTTPYYACNDDACGDDGYKSQIPCMPVYTGHTYYIVVDGYGGDCGQYNMYVDYCVPSVVECPPNGIPEGEPDCYDEYVDNYNAGCNVGPPYNFQNVNCGDTICGKSGTYLFGGSQYRDTDWFRVVLTSPTTLSWKVVAEFPLLIFIINGGSENCVDYTILGNTTAAAGDTAFLSFAVPAGVYWLWAGPSQFSGIPCGKEYVGIVGCPPQVGCCQLTGSCAMMTEADCNTAGGTFHAAPYQCIDNQCQIPLDTLCHLQWDNGSPAWYYPGYTTGDQQGNYFDPQAMCPGCGPDVYPFLISQVSGVLYDFGGAGTHNVMVHIYSVAPDSCAGPGAELYSFGPVTVTTFYPSEVVIPLPEVLCVNEDFIVTFEFLDAGVCVLWTSEAVANCISWLWCAGVSPGWLPMEQVWSGVGYHMVRADGVCNSGACAQGVECDLIQDHGQIAYFFSGLSAGDQLAKYFDPEVYCTPPVYPYKVHDVDIVLYDFAGVGTVDLRIGVNTVCHDSCDGPGTQIYRSDPITVTTFYPSMAHIVLPQQVCVYEPFFIVVEWASGAAGSTPCFLMEPETYPCDTCHAWLWYDGYSPPWWEWSDFWSPPVPGCPIVRVSGFTEHPDCQMAPCDTTLETLWGGLSPTYVWRNPSRYGDRWLAERFDLPGSYGGRLDQMEFAFYSTGSTGTPDPDFFVWLPDPSGVYPSDNNPPYQAIASFHLDYPPLWYPSYTVVQTWQNGIIFDPGESFFIGYGHAYTDGDTLRCLSDNGALNSNRSVEWALPGQWGTMLDDWGYGIDYMFNAVICPYTPPESTFTIACAPPNANAVPGDPPMNLFTVDVGSVLGYNLNVDLSCTPPAGIHVSFNPDNVPAPYTSNVSVSVDAPYVYGDYTLTFCGTGADGQGPKCCNVTLTVQPPFDEADVAFFHGSQKASNFGAVANDAANNNFLWYGLTGQLFDGTFIVSTTDDEHMALDVYNCVHMGWLPTGHLNLYYDPIYNANIAYGNFFTPESVISCEYDSLFIVGIMETCVDFSIKIKVYYNPTPIPIVHMYPSFFEDWDVGDAYNNRGGWDEAHNILYQVDPVDPTLVFGMMKAPFYDDAMYNMWVVPNPYYVWPGQGFCGTGTGYLLDDLYGLISTPAPAGYAPWPGGPATYPATLDTDYSILMTAPPIDLLPGQKHIEVWIDFGRNLNDGLTWSQWWHRVLRYAGFYRGDVNASDTLELPSLDVSDLVYLISYQFENGPAPKPYADQGDVTGDGIVNIADIIYLLNYVFKNGPAPIDYMRFIPQKWTRESLFENPNWR